MYLFILHAIFLIPFFKAISNGAFIMLQALTKSINGGLKMSCSQISSPQVNTDICLSIVHPRVLSSFKRDTIWTILYFIIKLLKSLVYKQTSCFPKEINNSFSCLLSAMNSWSSCAIKKSWPLELYVPPFFFCNRAISGSRRTCFTECTGSAILNSSICLFSPPVSGWTGLPREGMESASLEMPQTPVDTAPRKPLSLILLCAGRLDRISRLLPTSAVLWFWTAGIPLIPIVFPSSYVTKSSLLQKTLQDMGGKNIPFSITSYSIEHSSFEN